VQLAGGVEIARPEAERDDAAGLARERNQGAGSFLLGRIDERLDRAVRNIPLVKVLTAQGLNVYDLVCARRVVIPQAALAKIQEAWS